MNGLAPPPAEIDALRGFPTRQISPQDDLWRCVRHGFGPWWFGSSLAGRFDLPEPHGTCYLARDELAALLEVIGPNRLGGAVSADFLAQRRLRRLNLPKPVEMADLVARAAVGFGITGEISTLLPYELPQAWARQLHQAGAPGVLYRLRHDPEGAEGIALFGYTGERKTWRRGRERTLSSALLRRLREECNLEVLEIPRANQLDVLD